MHYLSYKHLLLSVCTALICSLGLSGCGSASPSDTASVSQKADTTSDSDESADTKASAESGETSDEKPKSAEDTLTLSGISFTDIYGNEYTDLFADYDMTVVNIFATWCSPCIRELPELQKLSEAMQDENIGVAGVVLDVYENGTYNEETAETAKLLAEDSGVTYPFLVPDETYLNGILMGVQSVPTTLFVDRSGNVISATVGSRDFDAWKETVNQEFEKIS